MKTLFITWLKHEYSIEKKKDMYFKIPCLLVEVCECLMQRTIY